MPKSAVTVSLVEEARGGPFVFWDGVEHAFETAAELGFDAIEIFAPGPDDTLIPQVKQLSAATGLAVAAVGTGAGMVKHGLNLTATEASERAKARDFIRSMIDFGAEFDAPAIIGSMQGRWGGPVSREEALGLLSEALNELGAHAGGANLPLLYEPLNRYETNLFTTTAAAAEFVSQLDTSHVKLLADLFHMNIEEANIAAALKDNLTAIGHIHFVDSNRQATGLGHMDYEPIAAVLQSFDAYLSAEAFPLPDSKTAAQKTMEMFRRYFAAS